MNVPSWIKELSQHFKENGHQLYLVGGAVRNQLINHSVDEWDFTTDAHPEVIDQMLTSYKASNIVRIGKRFGTLMAEIHNEKIEITTFRGEHYEEQSRKPEVNFAKTLDEDLSRRDFTINAMAWDILNHRLIDPFNGQEDIDLNLIRAVGQPAERFSEDPLRMLRAIRFATTLNFTIDDATLEAIASEKSRFGILSAERVAQEMDKILLAETPSTGLVLLVKTGLISYILPELIPTINLDFDPREHKDIYSHILQVTDQTPPKLELRWCALLHDIAKPLTRKKINNEFHFLGHEQVGGGIAKTVLRRLKYSNDFVAYVVKLVKMHQRLPNYDGNWTDGAIRRFVREAGECLNDLFVFARADSTGKNERKNALYEQNRQTLLTAIHRLEQEAEIAKIKSPLDGQELMRLFQKPAGPWIKPIKEHLLALVLDGQLSQNDKEKAAAIAKGLHQKN